MEDARLQQMELKQQQQRQQEQQQLQHACSCVQSSEEVATLLPVPPSPPPLGHRTARSHTHTEADKPATRPSRQQQSQHQQLMQHRMVRCSSSPRISGGCSRAARQLGRFVDEALYSAFLSGPDQASRRCIDHVIKCLRCEILHPAEVLSDLQEYRADVGDFLTEFGDSGEARQTLCELEYRVATLRDRLLFPLHCQQLIDLSHVCGCIHSVRMRLGHVAAATKNPGET